MQTPNSNDYLQTAIRRLKHYKDLGDRTLAQLNEEEINYSPGPESNSIAVIVRHLSGNMLSRWTHFLTEDGEKSWRGRDAEFAPGRYSRDSILEAWDKGWACFLDSLSSLKASDLGKSVTIRQEPLSVIDAINRQLTHYPYHIGQMVYLGRMLKKENWINLSIAPGQSEAYNQSAAIKDPAKQF